MTTVRHYSEAQIAEKLELPRDTIAYIRREVLKKEEGHWEQRGRAVLISEPGLEVLLRHLKSDQPLESLDDCEILAKKSNGPLELTVKRLFPNRQLLLATLPCGNGDPARSVIVRVKDNRNFREKMKLRALPPAPGATGKAAFYQLEGRCPRYPGRY